MSDVGPSDFGAKLLARAREIAAQYRDRDGVIGAFLFGSAARPHADASSDVDVQVVVEDAALAAITEPRHARDAAGTTRISDVWIIGLSDLEALLELRTDQHRRRVADAVVLFDSRGVIASLKARAAVVPPATREARMRIYHFEMTSAGQKLQKAEKRDRRATAKILASEFVLAAGKLLSFERSEWPSPLVWMFEELSASGVPDDIVAGLRALAVTPSARAARALRGRIDAHLIAQGVRFVLDPEQNARWYFHTAEGREAAGTFGGTMSRLA